MKTRVLLGLVVVTAAVASVVAIRASQQRIAAERTRAGLATQRLELERRQQHWLEALAAANKDRPTETAVENRLANNEPKPAAPGTTAPKVAEPAPKAADSLQEWLEDPKVQVLHMAFERANLRRSYGPFFYAQRLTPEQIAQLSELIVASRMHRYDLSEINRKTGVPFSDPALKAEWERGNAETKAAMIALLGDDIYAKLSDYRRSLEIRNYVADLAGIAAVEGVPLTREQADTLTQAIANTAPAFASGDSASLGKVDWPKAEFAIQQILTAEQMKVLRPNGRSTTRGRSSSELFQAVMRAQREMKALR